MKRERSPFSLRDRIRYQAGRVLRALNPLRLHLPVRCRWCHKWIGPLGTRAYIERQEGPNDLLHVEEEGGSYTVLDPTKPDEPDYAGPFHVGCDFKWSRWEDDEIENKRRKRP